MDFRPTCYPPGQRDTVQKNSCQNDCTFGHELTAGAVRTIHEQSEQHLTPDFLSPTPNMRNQRRRLTAIPPRRCGLSLLESERKTDHQMGFSGEAAAALQAFRSRDGVHAHTHAKDDCATLPDTARQFTKRQEQGSRASGRALSGRRDELRLVMPSPPSPPYNSLLRPGSPTAPPCYPRFLSLLLSIILGSPWVAWLGPFFWYFGVFSGRKRQIMLPTPSRGGCG